MTEPAAGGAWFQAEKMATRTLDTPSHTTSVELEESVALDPGLPPTQAETLVELAATPRHFGVDGVVTVDEWLVSAGGFGKFQLRVLGLIGVLVYGVVSAFWVVQPVFLNPKIQDDLGVSKEAMSLTSSLTFLGWGVGAFIWTRLADRFGRKPILFSSCLASTAISVGSALSPEFWVYACCRLLLGACLGGMGATGYVLMIEFMPPEQRGPMTNLANAFFAIGIVGLAVVAWFLRDASWRVELLFDCLPAVLFLCCFRLVHESPRWLSTVGQAPPPPPRLG